MRSLKILVCGTNYFPEVTGIGKYTAEMCVFLAERGHQVRVITAAPHYPEWKVHPGYSGGRYRREIIDGVHVIRVPVWIPKKPSGVRRILHLMSFAFTSLFGIFSQWKWRPDLIWLVEPPLMCAPGVLAFSKLRKCSSWLHIQDYEVDAAFDMGLLKGRYLVDFAYFFEKLILKSFDRVSTISSKMLDKAKSKGVSSSALLSFNNWVDISTIQPLKSTSSYRQELDISENAFVALYSGNMGGKQGLEILADVARQLHYRTDIVFVFCGNGSGRAELEVLCTSLPNVIFLNLQPLSRLSQLLGLADVHLLPQRADAADLVMPSKLTGMMASGRPVIATANADTELGNVIASVAGCGLIVPPGDAMAFASALTKLADGPAAIRSELGASGRCYAESVLQRDIVLQKFEDDLQKCCA